jgi:hypothetical protein
MLQRNLWVWVFITSLCTTHFVLASSLANGEIVIDGRSVESMQEAEALMRDGSTIYLGPGNYSQGIQLTKNNVTLSGSQGTHFIDAAIKGKGAILNLGNDNIIESIECSEISVPSNNGACIRHQGVNLTVLGVYFHDSEQGILESKNEGTLTVKYSRFERLGNKGRAHGIYASGKALIVDGSQFIAMRSQGHAIKSRSESTTISRTELLTGNGNDSRLVDVPNGGLLKITDSILSQTNTTVNRQVIGYGLEKFSSDREHGINIYDNLVIMEREKGNEFLALPKSLGQNPPAEYKAYDNVLVGKMYDQSVWENSNTVYIDRQSAGLSGSELPPVSRLKTVLELLR